MNPDAQHVQELLELCHRPGVIRDRRSYTGFGLSVASLNDKYPHLKDAALWCLSRNQGFLQEVEFELDCGKTFELVPMLVTTIEGEYRRRNPPSQPASDAASEQTITPPPASEDNSGTDSPQPHTQIVDTWNDMHAFPESHTVRRDGVKESIHFQQKDGKDLTKTWRLFLRLYEAKGQSITEVDGPGVRQCINRLENKLHRLHIYLNRKKVDQHYIIAMLIGPLPSESKGIPG